MELFSNRLISVIVPVYNTEKYIERCLDSILNQTYRELEIILVDDGSTDRSGDICDDYACKDKRVNVIHQKNGGTVKARNAGLASSHGDYLAFVDSDDFIELDTYEQLLSKALEEQSDVVIFDVLCFGHSDIFRVKTDFSSDPQECLRRLMDGKFPTWIWQKFIRKDFFAASSVELFDNDDMFEDMLFTVKLFLAQPKISFIAKPLYHYNRQNESSLTSSKIDKNLIIARSANNVRHIAEALIAAGKWDNFASKFAIMAMNVKVACLRIANHEGGGIRRARNFFPYAHKSIEMYRMKPPINWIYWFGFNGGLFGKSLITFYLKIHR